MNSGDFNHKFDLEMRQLIRKLENGNKSSQILIKKNTVYVFLGEIIFVDYSSFEHPNTFELKNIDMLSF